MDSTYISIISMILAFISGFLAIIMNNRSNKKIQNLKNTSAKEIELLKKDLKKVEESENLKRKYSTPLLKAAEELHNKLNDIVRNYKRVLTYFKNLSKNLDEIDSVGKILTSPTKIYITNIYYQFARYFATIECIKKELGLIQLATDKETKAFYIRMRRTVAVFFSGRLHENIKICRTNKLKYQGRILEGAQTIMGESMLKRIDNSFECISYYDFCEKIASNNNFLQCFSPITILLEGLKVVTNINSNSVDFRWAKIIFFSLFLRELVEEIDTAKAVALLPEIEKKTIEYFENNPILKENLNSFKKAYGGF